ncbi:hypothetical protein B9Z55_023742 [Caenorhabditis nigoni]|uniref:Ras-GAP domain-containing protein n=1 Tax=Caenorhabditis nigoni TaxID=1611254 RepID=A0A2G5SRP3_9PELO|nr:hypothetical protein B9Z55_023742 [Caenorhabditis nigoni]
MSRSNENNEKKHVEEAMKEKKKENKGGEEKSENVAVDGKGTEAESERNGVEKGQKEEEKEASVINGPESSEDVKSEVEKEMENAKEKEPPEKAVNFAPESNGGDVGKKIEEKNEETIGKEGPTESIESNMKCVDEEKKPTESINSDEAINLAASPDGSDKSNEELNCVSVASPSPADRKQSVTLEDIDRTLDELQYLADDAYQMATQSPVKMFDKFLESNSAYLKKCETVPENLTSQQFSEDEDGILDEIEEAVRDAEDKLYLPNHVSAVLDTECSSDDDGASDRYPALTKLDELRQDDSGPSTSLRNLGGHRIRQRVSSDRRSIISGHERARSNDSRATSIFSSSIASFRRPISHFSIDNSCFDIADAPTQRSLMCTPVEKLFVKNSRSAPEMRVNDTKTNPFLPSPSPSNDATTTTSDPSVSSELSVEQATQPSVVNLRLRLSEGLTETVSPVSSPVMHSKAAKKDKKENQQLLKNSASSPNMNSTNLVVNTMRPEDVDDEIEASKLDNKRKFEVVTVKIGKVEFAKAPKKPLYVMAKFDGKDVHRSLQLEGENLSHEFSVETTDSFSNLHLVFLEGSKAKVARPVGKVSIAKKELEVGTPLEQTLKLCPVSKYPDFCGQICVEIRRRAGAFSLRVVDYGGLKLKDNQTLLLLVSEVSNSSEVGKLPIDTEEKRSKEWLEMPCGDGMLSLKFTLWQDLLKGMNSVFHGQVRVDIDENWKLGPAKWFYLRPKGQEETDGGKVEEIGEITLKTTYQVDHILKMQYYKPLLDLLYQSGEVQPLTASLVAVIESLPKVELTPISRSLVELLAQTDHIRPVLSSLYVNSILKCQDENTLFRGQSLSGKMLFEMLMTFGKMYLISTLKPVIDRIFKERKNCEVDPSRVLAGVSVEKNKINLLVYFQMLYEAVTSSSANCPHIIKELLYDLRKVVGEHSERPGVQRLAVSSFIIMRFFAAAILNPKAFEVRKDLPDNRVSRTLLLLSKLLQRLSNCSVSDGPLSSKEIWLNGVFETVTSTEHKTVMASFLDNISLAGDRVDPQRCTVFKFGMLIQVDRNRMRWKRVLQAKRRYVQLTSTEISWQKDAHCPPKGIILLTDIKSVAVDNKHIITIAADPLPIQFEAPGVVEANDWYCAIEKQRNRALHGDDDESENYCTDAERHVDRIHALLFKYRDTMVEWRDQLQSDTEFDEKTPELLKASYVVERDRQAHKESLIATLCATIDVTDAIQRAHEEYEKENNEAVKIEEIVPETSQK